MIISCFCFCKKAKKVSEINFSLIKVMVDEGGKLAIVRILTQFEAQKAIYVDGEKTNLSYSRIYVRFWVNKRLDKK